MATIAADRARAIPLALLAAALGFASCAPLERGAPGAPPAVVLGLPRVRVGLSVGAGQVEIGGGAPLRVTRPDGSEVARLDPGERAQVRPTPAGFELVRAAGAPVVLDAAVVATVDTGFVRVDGRDYRGVVDLVRGDAGLVAANRIAVEDYLLGVVNVEMGRRGAAELEALRAQAVVSRTVAVRAIGRFPSRGYDLLATVSDQAYLGVGGELPQGYEAVRDTRGVILTWNGAPIDAFFHSTCGGLTAEPTESFAGAGGRPYLASVSDRDPSGGDYCGISPRYRWREAWDGEELARTLRETVPAGGVLGARIRDVAITRRGPTGRALALSITHDGGRRTIEGGNALRAVLRPSTGGLLRSALFELAAMRDGAGITRLTAEGRGAGHGVGFCQWGAVGRARAGTRWPEILAAYFPGAVPTRLY